MVVAHAGHWAVQLLYITPLIIVLLTLGWQRLKERRREHTTSDATSKKTNDDR